MSARLATLEKIFVECVECVLNNDSAMTDEKFEVIKDIHNTADMFTEQLQLLRREVAQQELLASTPEDSVKLEIQKLRTKIQRRKNLIAKSHMKFQEWRSRVVGLEEQAISSYSRADGT